MLNRQVQCTGQKGFTLIEMLVVIGITVALGAVIVPLVVQFSGSGAQAAEAKEWDSAQSAIDIMMADNEMGIVTASAVSTQITDTLNWGTVANPQTLVDYTRDPITQYCYEWTVGGRLIAQYRLDTSSAPPSCTTVLTGGSQSPTSDGFQLRFGLDEDRFPSNSLGGQTISGNVYVFLDDPDLLVDDVEFYLDSVFVRLEDCFPFDFAMTDSCAGPIFVALPWDTSEEFNGIHNIKATVIKYDASVVDVTSSFWINN